MSYYKHTSGESFTLNGENYVGYFNITDGIVYTGRIKSSDSEVLGSRNTMISNFYTDQFELDTTYKNISEPIPFYSNSFDLLNLQGLTTMLGAIDDNNLTCFKNLIVGNPTIYNFENNNGKFYGLSSIDEELFEEIPPKYELCNIFPFSDSKNFKFLDRIHTGSVVVDTFDNFKYLCADDEGVYVFEGNFSDDSNLKLLESIPNQPYYNIVHEIIHDERYNKFILLRNDTMGIYDASNYAECNKLILEDQIKLPYDAIVTEYIWDTVDVPFDELDITFDTQYTIVNPNNIQYVKFGYNLRTSIEDNVLMLYNKHSSDIIKTINLSLYDVENVIDLDIRDTDDYVALLHKKNSEYFVLFVDPYGDSYKSSPIYSLEDLDAQNIKFVYHDSNVISIYNKNEYQYRYISNPSYPSGRLETGDLYYFLEDYKWDTTDQIWNYFPILWDGVDSDSNAYNNLIVATFNKNNKMYMILHNKGRIYVLNQPMNQRFTNFVPIDIEKFYDGIECSEFSLGLNFNLMISNILKDVMNLYNQSSSSYTLEERSLILNDINNFVLDSKNLYMNGNETMNVIVLQRILALILDIQRKLLPNT